jgi:anti-anti-sigma factor
VADQAPVEFDLAVDYARDQVVLRVHGELDALTAPVLGATLRVLVEQSATEMVLDLAGLRFMDASGLDMMADISALLATTGRTLILRSPPPMTVRILDITRMDELVRLDKSAVGPARQAGSLARTGSGSNNTVIDAALRLVTVLAAATVDGADGASVTLERRGRMTTVASSNDTVLRMDAHQYETGEGPCLSAASQGRGFHIESLADETRWPVFVPLAMEEGIASILSTPLLVAERSIGALNIYSNAERAFGPHQQEFAALFASQASGILADADADVTDGETAERIADALLAREVIAQAQGVLISRQHLTADRAALALYEAARSAQTTVREHATSIVTSAHSDMNGEPGFRHE